MHIFFPVWPHGMEISQLHMGAHRTAFSPQFIPPGLAASHRARFIYQPALLYCLHPYCSTWLTLATVLEKPLLWTASCKHTLGEWGNTGARTDLGPSVGALLGLTNFK
jgi:hypothetical protein